MANVQDYMKDNRFGVPKPHLLGDGKKFTAKDNFPDLSKHNNVMASHLTPEVSELFSRVTESFFSVHCRCSEKRAGFVAKRR